MDITYWNSPHTAGHFVCFQHLASIHHAAISILACHILNYFLKMKCKECNFWAERIYLFKDFDPDYQEVPEKDSTNLCFQEQLMKRPSPPRSLLTPDMNILINFHQTYSLKKKASCFNLHFDYFVFIIFICFFLNCGPKIECVWFQCFRNYWDRLLVLLLCCKLKNGRSVINLSCLVKLNSCLTLTPGQSMKQWYIVCLCNHQSVEFQGRLTQFVSIVY